jgi:AcrR family transcriptional regulator
MTAGLREKKRLDAMQRAQAAAIELFCRRGFDAVSMEEIAEHAEIGVATLYRYFGTKERLIIWDTLDSVIERLPPVAFSGKSPLAAIRDLVLAALDAAATDKLSNSGVNLRRLQLITDVPALRTAALENEHQFAVRLGGMIQAGSGGKRAALEAQVLARAAVAALAVAIETWTASRGKEDPRKLVRAVFEPLI